MGYKKLETFDNKQTNWGGLWWYSEYNGFSSACYHFCLKDAQADVFHILEIEEDAEDDVPRDKDGNRLYTEEEVM